MIEPEVDLEEAIKEFMDESGMSIQVSEHKLHILTEIADIRGQLNSDARIFDLIGITDVFPDVTSEEDKAIMVKIFFTVGLMQGQVAVD